METTYEKIVSRLTGAIITIAWVATLTAGIITHDYQGLTLVTPVMLIYAGFVFGSNVIKKRLPERDNDV